MKKGGWGGGGRDIGFNASHDVGWGERGGGQRHPDNIITDN